MPCVVDASFALSFVLPDEQAPPDEVIRSVVTDGGIVPSHWPTEVVNGCLMAVRRGRLTQDEIRSALADLAVLQIEVASADALGRSDRLVTEALRHGLSIYDMAYLELAGRLNVPLATHDRKLAEAARTAGVRVL